MPAMPETTQVLRGVALKIGGNLREATFLERLTRFSCLVHLDEQEIEVHFPNSGRHRELLVPGQVVILQEERGKHRKTGYDLIMVRHKEALVSVDARVPNKLFARALEEHALPEFTGYRRLLHEVSQGRSRLDFLLENDRQHWVEVKSVTLVEGGRALFPDAPTQRGRRHLQELIKIVSAGDQASNVFVIQREDVQSFSPHDEADLLYGQTLREAARRGVRILAYTCRVTMDHIRLKTTVPLKL